MSFAVQRARSRVTSQAGGQFVAELVTIEPPTAAGSWRPRRLIWDNESGIGRGKLTIANARVVRTIKARPVDLLDADRAAALSTGRRWPDG
jgi:hypothetical protein